MKSSLIAVSIAAVALVTLGLIARHPAVSIDPAWQTYDHAHQVEYWATRVHALGADAAYKEFASQVEDVATNHEKAHAFGGGLYEAVGLSGITTCDFRFQYGCFHEFIGKAIADRGLSVVSNIDADCQQAVGPSGCRHGIGHALMYYYGYTLDGLTKALVSCDTYTKTYPYEGCYAGVFMEFNTQIMLGDEGKIRPLEHNDYVYPCADLDTKYRAVCAYHQTRWWNNIFAATGDQNDFARLGGLCRALSFGREVRLACFAGLGVLAGNNLNYDPNFSVTASCDKAGTTVNERLACRAFGAAFMYASSNLSAQIALETCQGLPDAAYAYCASYTTDKALFVQPKPLPTE